MFKRCSFLLLLLPSFSTVFSQKLDTLLEIQRNADPQEKIYVHFDKNYYNPGETMWFKAYLFTGTYPSEASKNFYAELLDESGNVLSRRTAPILFSGASGSFDIDSNFSKPAVYFKAYTVSMLNSDTNFLYTKAIRILALKATNNNALTAAPETKLSLLPEGGDLVAGVPSNVAFIASNPQGLPVRITGVVTDNKGTKVAELKTLHNGMGQFILTPEADKTYTATWKDERGKSYTTVLPTAKAEGLVLKLTDEGDNKRFTLNRTASVTDAQKQLHIIAYMNQELSFKADINMADRISATGIFPTKLLSSGLLKVTVFDNNYKPVAERITFVNNHDYEFDGDVYLTQRNLTKRGLNKVEVMISDTLPANLSLSVIDADLNEPTPLEDNIVSHMLLSGELRGKIVNPYYYFSGNHDSTALYLDLVMLTHGWRRYNWDNVLAGKTATPQWKESNYLSLSGKVIGLPAGSIGNDLQLTSILQTADSAKSFLVLPVDRKGDVSTDGLIFYDKAKLYFNSNNKNLSIDNSMLVLNNGLYPGYKKTGLDSSLKKTWTDVSTSAIANNTKIAKMAQQARVQAFNKSVTLGNVTVKAKTKTAAEKMEEKYVSGLFSGDGTSFDLVNDPLAASYMNIFQYLQGKVAGLQISTGGAEPTLSWRGGAPALYLNEMKTDASMISGTPVSDIAYIKVIRPGESIAYGGGNGVIAIYTRKGGDVQTNSNVKGMSSVSITGYSPVKEFYSPDYATPSERDGIDDYRTTLYWNPTIYLDKSKKRLRLQFYNNDVTKRFRLVLEGINADGKLIHVEKEVPNQWE